MSEQAALSAGGGLLSLNLSLIPQSARSTGAGAQSGFAGFGAMLNQQSAGGVAQSQSPDGVFLPPQGIALPQGEEGDPNLLSQQELMRQQLLYVSQMLDQRGSENSELPEELRAELSRALREYSEQSPVLPEEASAGEQVAVPASSTLPLDENGMDPGLVSSVKNGELAGEASDRSGFAGNADVNLDVANAQKTAAVNSESQTPPTQANGINSQQAIVSPVSDQARQAIYQEQQNANSNSNTIQSDRTAVEPLASPQLKSKMDAPAPDSVEVRAEVRGAVQDLAAAKTETGSVKGVMGKPVESVTTAPVVPKVVEELPVERAVVSDRNSAQELNKGSYAAQIGERATAEGGRAAVVNPPAPSLQGAVSDQAKNVASSFATDAESSVGKDTGLSGRVTPPGLSDKAELSIHQSRREFAQAAVPEVNVRQQETVIKPQGELNPVSRFEASMDTTQQLLQKFAAGEKIDTSSSSIIDKPSGSSAPPVTSQTQSLTQPSAAQKTVTEGQNLMMPQHIKMNTPAWNNALGERAIMVAAQSGRVAEIQLDPPELGSLNIRVQVNNDQVSLNFTSPHAHVRDAVEQSLPRLREMFAEQGLALQDSSVSDHSSDQQREHLAQQEGDSAQYGSDGEVNLDAENSEQSGNMRSVSMVDYYA